MQNSETVEFSTQKRKIRNLHAVMSHVLKSNIHIHMICRCASNFSLKVQCTIILRNQASKSSSKLKVKKLFTCLYKHYLILELNSWN